MGVIQSKFSVAFKESMYFLLMAMEYLLKSVMSSTQRSFNIFIKFLKTPLPNNSTKNYIAIEETSGLRYVPNEWYTM